jgi:transcriptional regulator with XRE-family HTH domain
MAPARDERSQHPGSTIRLARRQRSWTQADLGRRTGYSASAISRIESGQTRLDLDTIFRFADALREPLELFGLTTPDSRNPTRSARSGEQGIRLHAHGDGEYGVHRPHRWPAHMETANPMTTLRALAAARESVAIALNSDPTPDDLAYIVRAAAEHYAQVYSKIPPGLLYEEVYQTRAMVLEASATNQDVLRASGWLTSLLGNLSIHLSDPASARLHLTSAASVGRRYEDLDLRSWSNGALAMVARSTGDHDAALAFARVAVEAAPAGLRRAQALMWASLPSLAAIGDAEAADSTIAEADRQLEAAEHHEAPGRFGFDLAERNLHEADAQLVLGRHERAARIAQTSVDACEQGTPGWAAAALALAQAEVVTAPLDAIARAGDVLYHVPPERLRATARTRLTSLTHRLTSNGGGSAVELVDRVRSLPTLVDIHGYPIG